MEGKRRDSARARSGPGGLSGEHRERWHHGKAVECAMGSLGETSRTPRRTGDERHLLPAPHRAGRPGEEMELAEFEMQNAKCRLERHAPTNARFRLDGARVVSCLFSFFIFHFSFA